MIELARIEFNRLEQTGICWNILKFTRIGSYRLEYSGLDWNRTMLGKAGIGWICFNGLK